MTTLSELKTARADAGAAYAAAAAAYLDAWVELKAYDMALSNNNVAGGVAGTFGGDAPVPCPHSEFLRSSIHGELAQRAQVRHVAIIKSLG